jgi:hypothetical protein
VQLFGLLLCRPPPLVSSRSCPLTSSPQGSGSGEVRKGGLMLSDITTALSWHPCGTPVLHRTGCKVVDLGGRQWSPGTSLTRPHLHTMLNLYLHPHLIAGVGFLFGAAILFTCISGWVLQVTETCGWCALCISACPAYTREHQ